MKYNFIVVLFFLLSCSATTSGSYKKPGYISKGFAYIYSSEDYENKVIKKKINNNNLIISNKNIRRGALVKITNPNNGKNILLKNDFKTNYPDFYKIMLSKAVSNNLDLDEDFPFVEIEELKKNKSFIAKSAETHEEERQLKNNAPVEKVSISNISKNKTRVKNTKKEFVIILGNFYSLESALLLKKRIKSESNELKNRKISILKKNKHNFEVFLGPYKTIKKIKNDYIALKKINFDEVDLKIYD